MSKKILLFLSVIALVVPLLLAGCGGSGTKVVSVPVTNISHNAGDSLGPRLAIDREDGLHLAWFDLTAGDNDIFYSAKASGGTWTDAFNISDNPTPSRSPSIAVDSQGTVHVVWQDFAPGNYDIFYSQKPKGGNWSTPYNVSNNPEDSTAPSVAVDGQGIVHVAWQQDVSGTPDIFYSSRAVDGTWATPVNVSNNSGESDNPSLAVDAQRNVHLVWFDKTPGNEDIFYATKPNGGTWSTPVNISNNTGDSEYPVLAADSQGTVNVAWQDNTPGNWEIFYSSKPAGGSWSTPFNISRNSSSSGFPTIAVDDSNNVYLAWHDNSPNITQDLYEIFYVSKPKGGDWSSPVNISGTSVKSGDPSIGVDSHHTVHVAWSEYLQNNWDVVYASTPGIVAK